MKSLFVALNAILKAYDCKSLYHDLENKLIVQILHSKNMNLIGSMLTDIISTAEERIFVLKNKIWIIIIIDHSNLQPLQGFITKIEGCSYVIMDENRKQSNNIIFGSSKDVNKSSIGDSCAYKPQQTESDVEMFLRICELFYAHLHIMATFRSINHLEQLQQCLMATQQPEQHLIQQMEQCKYPLWLLRQRISPVTMEELNQVADISHYYWGTVIEVCQGYQGIIIWVCKQFLPAIVDLSFINLQVQRLMLPIRCHPMGYTFFRHKKYCKKPMKQLNLTTIIFNFQSKHIENYRNIVTACVQQIAKKYMKGKLKLESIQKTVSRITEAQRLCQIIDIDIPPAFMKYLFMQ